MTDKLQYQKIYNFDQLNEYTKIYEMIDYMENLTELNNDTSDII